MSTSNFHDFAMNSGEQYSYGVAGIPASFTSGLECHSGVLLHCSVTLEGNAPNFWMIIFFLEVKFLLTSHAIFTISIQCFRMGCHFSWK